jgi:hypothetical protein
MTSCDALRHLSAFLAAAAENDRSVADVVRVELERSLKCGLIEEGCAVELWEQKCRRSNTWTRRDGTRR